ncbi:hypothetical protein [Streptomyces sp. CNQ085]|uniref:hypothetical protein n=1 Tax=Streptomyces sp. CNQ085 TaxID=2886944 RepID=UPI001F50841D|nr:hypothetical protein [Streptomyces sp. CNQ085]MCI0385402.1 hypothetical protein [Streptomyces sp. CNQ085]
MDTDDERTDDPAAGLTHTGAGATREGDLSGHPPGFGRLRVRTRPGTGREVFRSAGEGPN